MNVTMFTGTRQRTTYPMLSIITGTFIKGGRVLRHTRCSRKDEQDDKTGLTKTEERKNGEKSHGHCENSQYIGQYLDIMLQ